jgi:hypothetical protein
MAFALAAVLLLGCFGDVAHALADERDACPLAKVECYGAPVALDLSALPASAPILGAPAAPSVFALHPTFSDGHRSHVADAAAPRAPPVG